VLSGGGARDGSGSVGDRRGGGRGDVALRMVNMVDVSINSLLTHCASPSVLARALIVHAGASLTTPFVLFSKFSRRPESHD